jgi:predicted nucleotidyltransferase
MDKATAIAKLRRHEAELRKLGVVSLSLFGSTARGEAGRGSHVDVAVRLEKIDGGFAYFGRLVDVERRLRRILGTRVGSAPTLGGCLPTSLGPRSGTSATISVTNTIGLTRIAYG